MGKTKDDLLAGCRKDSDLCFQRERKELLVAEIGEMRIYLKAGKWVTAYGEPGKSRRAFKQVQRAAGSLP